MTGRALVTGASAGIGRALAREFARNGHDLVLVARGADRLASLSDDLTAEHGVDAVPVSMDLSDDDAPARLEETLATRGLAVDALVNNVGVGVHGRFGETDREAELRQLRLNVHTLVDLTHRFLDDRQTGQVLNVGSTAGFVPGPHMAGYYASKAYVNRFSAGLAAEHADDGVDVTVVCPGPVATEFHERAGIEDSTVSAWVAYEPEPVARAAYRGLQAGESVVVPGLAMKAVAALAKVTPGPLVRWGARKVLVDR